MHSNDWTVTAVAWPSESRLTDMYACPDLVDAYSIRLPTDAVADPEQLARFLLSHQAPWATQLLRLRDALVAPFGIKTTKKLLNSTTSDASKRISFFKIYEQDPREIVLGEDDRHLDFRLSILHQTKPLLSGSAPFLTLLTIVHCHNRLGRIYLALIAPFHRRIIQTNLRRAARVGWPTSHPLPES